MRKKIILTLGCIFLGFQFAYAEPIINSISDDLAHKQVITLKGENFGVKDPAAPLVWDPCDHSDPLSARYDGWQSVGCDNPVNDIAYRSPGFRNIQAPHQYNTNFIAGAHGEPYHNPTGNNVLLTKAGWNESKVFLALYYWRLDPNFPIKTNPDYGPNLKSVVMNEGSVAYSSAGHQYIDHSNAYVPASVYPNDAVISLKASSTWECADCRHEHQGINGSPYPNPMRTDVGADNDGWQKMDWQWLCDGSSCDAGFVKLYVDNVLAVNCPAYYSTVTAASATIGGFHRWPNASPDDAFQYFSDVYMDNTFSRVILANAPNYNNATIKEPQIPSTWNDNSIIFTVNLGKLFGNTAYLFVFDADNKHNPRGYAVNIISSEDGGGTGTPQLAAPSGLEIVNIEN